MKKATRLFLKQRPNAEYVMVEEVKLDGTLNNHCYQNAEKLANTNETDLIIVSGWMVGDYYGERGTPIIAHYWVFNQKTHKYYDQTPKPLNHTQKYDYVEDFDIFKYGSNESYLPLSLRLLSNGKWQARNEQGTDYIDLDEIDVEELYKLRNA
jgi:hypothetical protein